MIFPRIGAYLKRDLDYPVSANNDFIENRSICYHLNLEGINQEYLLPNVIFDEIGIPRFNYEKVPPPNNKLGQIYNITYICWYALACLQNYLVNRKEQYKDSFLRQADWLLRNNVKQENATAWSISFPWNVYGQNLSVPRISSMDQGLAMSVLVRAYLLTDRKEYINAAIEGESIFDLPIEKGGFKLTLKDKDVFYEMYPSVFPSLILDGHIFAAMGLYDLYRITLKKETKTKFDAAANTVVNNIRYWDFGGIWSWFGRWYLSNTLYHKINISWLEILSRITGADTLANTASGWRRAFNEKDIAIRIKYRTAISSRVFMLKGVLGANKYRNMPL